MLTTGVLAKIKKKMAAASVKAEQKDDRMYREGAGAGGGEGRGNLYQGTGECFRKLHFYPGTAPELHPDTLKYRKPYVLFERGGCVPWSRCRTKSMLPPG
jgi:hypothetical protein